MHDWIIELTENARGVNPAGDRGDTWVSEWAVFYHQHSIGYTGDGFYRSKDPTNSIKVLKEMLQKKKKTTKTTKYRYT